MQLLIFLLYTVFFIIASIGMFKFLLIATQRGNFLGKWQDVIDWVYKYNTHIAKLLGACYMCFAHLLSIVTFCLYVAMLWDIWVWNWWQSILWYFFFVSFAWMGMYKQIPKDNGV